MRTQDRDHARQPVPRPPHTGREGRRRPRPPGPASGGFRFCRTGPGPLDRPALGRLRGRAGGGSSRNRWPPRPARLPAPCNRARLRINRSEARSAGTLSTWKRPGRPVSRNGRRYAPSSSRSWRTAPSGNPWRTCALRPASRFRPGRPTDRASSGERGIVARCLECSVPRLVGNLTRPLRS